MNAQPRQSRTFADTVELPILTEVVDTKAKAKVANPLESFRIQFATGVVQPETLPGFPYIASRIEFAAVLFTAIVHAPTAPDAVDRLKSSWPGAEIRYIEQGTTEFRDTDELKGAATFGAVMARPKTTWGKVKHFFR